MAEHWAVFANLDFRGLQATQSSTARSHTFFNLKAFSEDSCLHRAAIHFKVGLGQYVPTKSPTDVNHLPLGGTLPATLGLAPKPFPALPFALFLHFLCIWGLHFFCLAMLACIGLCIVFCIVMLACMFN